MNTITASTTAGVTVATIRTWARRGVIAATKQAGRWIIDAASLARRIAIGAMRARKAATMTAPTTPWDADHPNIGLLDQAVAAGVPVEQITEKIGPNSLYIGRRFSNRDMRAVDTLIAAYEARGVLLDQIAHLATCLGHDGAAKRRAAAAKLTNAQLHKMIADSRAYAREHRIDVRTPAEKAPRLASAAQIALILDLLIRRTRTGEGGGFFSGPTSRDGIATLTSAEASSYIDSLKGQY